MSKGSLIAAVAASIFALVFAGTASAQYPEPRGAMVCAVSHVSVTVHGSTQVTVTLRDAAGNPIANEPVYFSIVGQPGSSAALSTGSATTDASGRAATDLYVGDSAGQVTVAAVSASGIECRGLTQVVNPPTPTPVPGQSTGVSVQPPSTGDAGLAATGSSNTTALIALAGLGVVIGGGLAVGRIRRQTNR